VFGLVTLGLGWALFWLAWPASIVWAIVYYGASLGGPHSATVGMRMLDLELRTGMGHQVISCSARPMPYCSGDDLVPVAAGVLVGLFNGRRGCCTTSSWEPWLSTTRSRTQPQPRGLLRAKHRLTVASRRDAGELLRRPDDQRDPTLA
jgi:hypothetical protein